MPPNRQRMQVKRHHVPVKAPATTYSTRHLLQVNRHRMHPNRHHMPVRPAPRAP
jgi:hypothetical protein